MPNKGDLRVWWIRNAPNKPHHAYVPSVEAARQTIKEFTQGDLKSPGTFSNAGGLEVFNGVEWEEWYDKQDRDINGDN